MKLHYINLKANQILLLFICSFLFVSCGTYQSIYNDDGIYADETATSENKKVVVVNQKDYKQYNDNYFTEELNRLESIDNKDIFTDVDDYRSSDSLDINEDRFDDRIHNEPWGYSDNNDIVVQVNINTSPYWNDFYLGNFNNPWGYTNWGFRRGFNGFWGYNPYWPPYYYGYNRPYWSPYRYGYNRPYYNPYNIGYRNYRYGRRTAYNNRYSINNTVTSRRGVISKRNTSKTRRFYSKNNTTVRRSTRTSPNKSNTRVRRTTNSTPQRNTRSRNTSPRVNSSSTRNYRSNTNSRRNSSSRSSSSNRSSRSSSTRSSNSNRSSSNRSSSNRSSSRKRN
jgi:hypothetical protein